MTARIGLTGTLGSGKSTVARLLERWGAIRIDADRLAREAVEPGSDAHRQIRDAWGDRVIDRSGTVDRAALRRIVTSDPAARRRLEGIVHPAVRALRAERRRAAAARGAAWLVEEVPLLYEVGLEGDYDSVIVVDAPVELRRRRVVDGGSMTADEFEALEAAQLPGAEKAARGGYLIQNDGTIADLRSRTRDVWDRLTSNLPGGSEVS